MCELNLKYRHTFVLLNIALVLSSQRSVAAPLTNNIASTTSAPLYQTTISSVATRNIKAPQTLKFTAANVLEVIEPKDGLAKRNIKLTDLSSSSSDRAKSYDPPPEFYRSPGLTGSSTAASTLANPYNNRDSTTSGYGTKPITFPDTSARHKYSTDSSINLAKDYSNWQSARGQQGNNIRDRISVGHYGTTNHGSVHPASVYAYDSRPYVESHHNEYGYYPGSAHGGGSAGGGYYGSGTSAESVHFDLYGSKGHGHVPPHAAGHYAGGGGEYSYTYPELHESSVHNKEHAEHKALLAKSFLIPLASAAVLGIAAALVSNPLLLQLGTVSGVGVGVGPAVVGKRKRRDLSALPAGLSTEPEAYLADASADTLAYRAYQLQSQDPQLPNGLARI